METRTTETDFRRRNNQLFALVQKIFIVFPGQFETPSKKMYEIVAVGRYSIGPRDFTA
nr:hypothetical protein [Pantoea cypripedii]